MVNRFLIGVFIFVVGGMTWILLLPDRKAPTRDAIPSTASAAPATKAVEEPKVAVRPVRVVYPSPDAGETNNVSSAVVPAAKAAISSAEPVVAPTQTGDETGTVSAPPPALNAQPNGNGQPIGGNQAININSSSIESLNHLEGGGRIGVAIARHRPYRSIEDLLNKRVVRKDVYERIRAQLAVQ